MELPVGNEPFSRYTTNYVTQIFLFIYYLLQCIYYITFVMLLNLSFLLLTYLYLKIKYKKKSGRWNEKKLTVLFCISVCVCWCWTVDLELKFVMLTDGCDLQNIMEIVTRSILEMAANHTCCRPTLVYWRISALLTLKDGIAFCINVFKSIYSHGIKYRCW